MAVVLTILLVLLALLALGTLVGRRRLLRRSLPQVRGEVSLEGIGEEVTITRDRHGIPHVSARSMIDAAFAMGFLHAQDRLWQLDLTRRVGSGRISEIAGADGVAADRFLRRVGLRRAAEAEAASLRGESLAMLEAYAAGINALIASSQRLPVEFSLLKMKPEPWTVVDSLCCAKVLALGLSTNWDNELQRLDLLAALGPERAAQLDPIYPESNPTILAETTTQVGRASGLGTLELFREAARWLPSVGGASNSWVISGSRTQSGRPLLCNDPHLPPSVPSVWYAAHIRAGDDFESAGVTFAGIPFVIIGHNRRCAWGFTNSFADCQDLVIEDFEDATYRRYRTEAGAVSSISVREVIRVRGQSDVVEDVVSTRHGPVVERRDDPKRGAWRGLALQWTALSGGGDTVGSNLRLQRARDWESFRASWAGFDAPSQNVVYADVDGHIGYTLCGLIPRRAGPPSGLPRPGWTGEARWLGYLSAEELPQLLDPPQGLIVTANNRVVGDSYPHYIGADYMNGYRAARIHHMLEDRHDLAAKEMAEMQMDLLCLPAREVSALLRDLQVEGAAEKVRRRLVSWDGQALAETEDAHLYELFITHLSEQALRPLCGDLWGAAAGATLRHEVFGYPGNIVGRLTPELLRRWREDDTSLFAGTTTWRAVVALALGRTASDRRRARRPTRLFRRPTWGMVHRLPLQHPLAVRPPLRLLLNAGNLCVGGNMDTVMATSHIPGQSFVTRLFAPSWRQVCDVGAWDHFSGVHLPGQSGQPGSRHFADLKKRWLRNQQVTVAWSDEAVRHAAASRLRLLPQSTEAGA